MPELLGQDVGGGVGVEEAQTHDLADDLGGASRLGLGSAFAAVQGGTAVFEEGGTELTVALLAEAVLGCSGGGAEAFAFAFDEHGVEIPCGSDEQPQPTRAHRCAVGKRYVIAIGTPRGSNDAT